MGLEAFLLAQPFMEAREKKAVGTCPKGKQLKATPLSPAIRPSTAPALPFFSGPWQLPGPWWLWRKQLRRGPALLSHLIVGDKRWAHGRG